MLKRNPILGLALVLAMTGLLAKPAVADDGPTTPKEVVAVLEASSVTVDWAPSTSDVDIPIYFVKVNGNWHWTVEPSITLYLDRSTNYQVEVQAQDTSYRRSPWSEPIEFTTPDEAPVTTPGDVDVASSPGALSVVWTSSTSDAGVMDYIVTLDGGEDGSIAEHTSATHASFEISPGGDFELTVRARDNAYRLSHRSAPVGVSVDPSQDWQPPTPPTNLRASFDPEGRAQLLSWDATTGGIGPVTYSVKVVEYNNTAIESTTDLSVELLEFGRCPDNPSNPLTFVVTATANGVESSPSESVTLCFA